MYWCREQQSLLRSKNDRGENGYFNMTLFRSITMLCGIDSIPRSIPHIQYECGEFMDTISPTNICYGFEQCNEVDIGSNQFNRLSVVEKESKTSFERNM